MHRFIEIVKAHPMAIGVGVLVGVALIFLATRSGTATGGNYAQTASPDAALAAVNAQLVAQQDAIRMQGNLAATALQAHLDDNQTALSLSNISASVTMDENGKMYNLAQQKETDLNNTSLLSIVGQTLLASQQQGYTATLQAQGNAAANINAAQSAAQGVFDDRLWRAAYGGNIGGNAGGGGGARLAQQALNSTIASNQAMFGKVSGMADAAAAISNVGLQNFYAATLHQLTEPVSSTPTAISTSH